MNKVRCVLLSLAKDVVLSLVGGAGVLVPVQAEVCQQCCQMLPPSMLVLQTLSLLVAQRRRSLSRNDAGIVQCHRCWLLLLLLHADGSMPQRTTTPRHEFWHLPQNGQLFRGRGGRSYEKTPPQNPPRTCV